ncbi:KIR protein [Plasmodium knowlesi strain H]|uniref:KIR protein n=3 Tax=Plasmodium knowlesi TaxID=5850 RepID=A0A5K1VJW5_PLAKH|nr:KIR protein [Plasmodium knowlesi strain H]OTN68408.1 KIR protein [Plasmodium knowlesi]CAA9986634.1 KIR protein [Plasmodium knowlesi strain H]SBO24085.1 KIR protein [Plasmodium knowlesi strain H]SBO29344.1 KIR protein [Plasmodium knowlesi strain H]VVS76108.1 KIR protein [Plasmodium knowlesi strain H]|eukprot:XP_002261174.1 KIR protein [Plasmodium knowlesi strain H]
MVTMDGQKVDLDKDLPSRREFYEVFNTADGYTQCPRGAKPTEEEAQLKSKLSTYPVSLSFNGSLFTKAYCHACNKRGEYASADGKKHLEDAPCKFFYYWLGHTYSYLLHEIKLPDILGDIHRILGTLFNGNECIFKYGDISNDLLKHRKKLFEHYYDCTHVKEYLKQLKDSGGKAEDDVHWASYKLDVNEACKYVGEYCGGTGGTHDPYCKEYSTIYLKYCEGIDRIPMHCPTLEELQAHVELQTQLQDETETEPEVKSTALEFSGSGHERGDTVQTVDSHFRTTLPTGSTTGSGAQRASPIVSTAVGGTLFTLGLPLAAFLSYKYNLLPDWIKNSLFGGLNNGNNRRGGRRSTIGRNHHFDDTFTENSMDTSTNLSREVDSIMNLSTAPSTATEDNSTTYDESSGRQNNRRQQQLRRRQQGQRTNIAYYSM